MGLIAAVGINILPQMTYRCYMLLVFPGLNDSTSWTLLDIYHFAENQRGDLSGPYFIYLANMIKLLV